MEPRFSFPSGLAAAIAAFTALAQFGHLAFLGRASDTVKFLVFAILILVAFAALLRFGKVLFLPRVFPLLALFVSLPLLSVLAARQRFDALALVAALAVGLIFVVLVATTVRAVPRFEIWFVDSLLVCGVGAAALALFQYWGAALLGRSIWLPVLLPSIASSRVSGIYGQPNLFALFLTVVLLAFFYRYLHTELSWPNRRWSRWRHLPLVLVGTVFFLTQSLSGLLSFLLLFGVLCYLVMKGWYLCAASAARREFFLLLVALCVAFLVDKGMPLVLPSHPSLAFEHAESGAQRLVFWLASLMIFADHPWFGVGLDNFKSFYPHYQLKALTLLHFGYENISTPRWAHNELLQLLCEGGIFTFLLALVLLALFLFALVRWVRKGEGNRNPGMLYAHLFLLPFLFQAQLSWPLRFTPLFILFLLFVGLLLGRYGGWEVCPSRVSRGALAGGMIVGVLLAGFLLNRELAVAKLQAQLANPSVLVMSFPRFEALAKAPDSEFYVLRQMLPTFVGYAVRHDDRELATALVPFAKRMVYLEGSCWTWYNLAVLDRLVGDETACREAVRMAIDRKPDYDPAWNLLHYLNMLKASRVTGRPVESFFPPTLSPQQRNSIYGIFDRNRPFQRQ